MEVAPRVQEASSHAASLLASLNLQRGRAQFCDCVVIQTQSPGRLYPAHRCVLAASSPVLASILSSTGALVELQAPCLSDSVLALLLEYIYTGALPFICSHQQYYSLLTAACHLQMDELQEALRARQDTEVNATYNTNASPGAENHSYQYTDSVYSKTVNTFGQNFPSANTCSVRSLEREDRPYPANVDMCEKTELWRSSSENGANHRKCTSPLSQTSTCCSPSESTDSSVNVGNCRQITYVTPQDENQNIPCTDGASAVDKEVKEDQFHSAGSVKAETWQKSTEEEQVQTDDYRRSVHLLCTNEVQEEEMSEAAETRQLCLPVKSKAKEKQTIRKEEDKVFPSARHLLTSHFKDDASQGSSSPSFSSSPHPCCGAVPVICHSSRAAMGEASTATAHHPVSQASVGSSRAPDPRSERTDTSRIVEDITTEHRNCYVEQNQDYRHNKEHIGTHSWDYIGNSDQCSIQYLCYKSSEERSDIKQALSSSNTDHFTKQRDENMSNGLSDITGRNHHHAHSFQKETHTKYVRIDSAPLNKDCSSFTRRLDYKTDHSFDDPPHKHQRLDHSDRLNGSEEQSIQSQDPTVVAPLPVQDSDPGSDCCSEDFRPRGEVKAEHSYSSKSPAEMNRQDTHSHCNLYEVRTSTDWYQNLRGAEMNTDNERHSYSNDTVMTGKSSSVDVCLSVSTTLGTTLDTDVTGGLSALERPTALELEKMSGTEVTEPDLPFTVSEDNNMSDPTYSVVGQSYRGHLHYQCLPQEGTHLSHENSDHKHSYAGHPAHSDHSSDDDDDDDDEVGSFASPGHNHLRQHFVTTDKVLLLDISAKPAELLVSCKHSSDRGEQWGPCSHRDTDRNASGNNDRQQWNEITSVEGDDVTKIRAGTKCGSESCDETKSWVRGTNAEDRKSAGKALSLPGAEVTHRAKVVEGESQTTTLTVCSASSAPDYVKASMSTALSVCMPSTLSASMPTNISAHLSTPVQHPFQCSMCDRSFSQRGSLNRHVRSHLGVRPFPCPRCPMTFSRQYRVTEHMRVHLRCALESDFQKPPASSI